jgi:NAD(P)-dependent dehydrogenase (short-subunit alcohol dehydrogenase family)
MSGAAMMFSLENKTAFITGGSSGIGFGVARTFCHMGANVVIGDIVDGKACANEIGAHFLSVDVSDEMSVERAIKAASESVGGMLDVVVLNAGVGDVGPTIEQTDVSLIEKVTKINYWGVLYGLKHAPTYMNDGGSIIVTSSMAAFINIPGSGVYSAAKRAVTSMTEMAALELGKRSIRVNAVCPGYTATALGSGKEGEVLCQALTALGRVAEVEDMVGTFAFLASDASRYLTGQTLKVDGGWSCGPTERLLEIITGSSTAPR